MPHKGKAVIAKVKELCPEFEFRQMMIDPPVPFNAKQFAKRKERFYADADIALSISAHEGNSYFLLDALAMGVQVVGTDVGLVPQIPRTLCKKMQWEKAFQSPEYVAEALRRAWRHRPDPDDVRAWYNATSGRLTYAAKMTGVADDLIRKACWREGEVGGGGG